ncbi:hypothetical protein [Capnocytophaga canis]|uniref:hypothetical protein n=1 Tax=Capnocytophaga canis TaxID=1848903 RepID=UPI001561C4F1|nr:hypothetical protein [Capnocytophaga canis]
MKLHNLIFFLKFSLTFLFLLGCEKNEIFIDQSKTENLSDRISLDEAKKSFDFLESQKNKKKQTEKGGYSLPLFADWDKFQEERSSFDVIFSTVPVTLSNKQVKGDVIFLKYKGSITQYLFMTKELFDNEGEVIGNQLFLFDTEGVFIDAYKMENGIITKRLVLPWKANNRTRRSLHEEGCRASLLLQEDVGHVSKKLSNRPSGSGWEVGCGSIGGAGTEKDPFILSEVEVIHKKKDTQGPPSSFSVNNFYGFMPGNNQYFYNHFNNYKNEFDTDIYCAPTNIYFGVVIAKASNRIAEFKEFINSTAGLGSYDSPEKREVLSFAELHNFSEGAIGFVKKAITLLSKENRKYLIDIVDFKRKDSSLSVEQSIMLSILKGNPNPLTGKPIELYALLRYKNPTYFDVSFFSKGGENLTIGEYTLTPHYSANHKLVFYAAGRQLGYGLKNGIEYIIQPDALNDFRERIDLYTASANIFYLNGIPNQGQIALAAGDYIEGLTKMWGEALHSAEWWAYAITTMGQAVISLPTGATVNSTITTKQWKTSMRDLTSKFFQGKKVVNNQGVEVVIRIPDDYVATITNNGKGINFRPLGSTDNTNLIRVMSPGKSGGVFYPKGYVVFYNSKRQPYNPNNGQTFGPENWHFEF